MALVCAGKTEMIRPDCSGTRNDVVEFPPPSRFFAGAQNDTLMIIILYRMREGQSPSISPIVIPDLIGGTPRTSVGGIHHRPSLNQCHCSPRLLLCHAEQSEASVTPPPAARSAATRQPVPYLIREGLWGIFIGFASIITSPDLSEGKERTKKGPGIPGPFFNINYSLET